MTMQYGKYEGWKVFDLDPLNIQVCYPQECGLLTSSEVLGLVLTWRLGLITLSGYGVKKSLFIYKKYFSKKKKKKQVYLITLSNNLMTITKVAKILMVVNRDQI